MADPSTVSNFGDGDTLGGSSTVNSGTHTFNGSATNLAGATLTLSHGSSLQQWNGSGGGGVLYNKGTWNYSGTARGGFSIRGGTMTVRNQGLFESTAPTVGGGNFYFSHSSGAGTKRWINEAGSIFRHSAATTFDFEVAGAIDVINDGTVVATNGGTIVWGSGVNTTHSSSPGSIWDSTDGTITIAGGVSNLSGTAVGNPVNGSSFFANEDTSILNMTGQGIGWSSGSWSCNNNVLKNEGLITVTSVNLPIVGVNLGDPDVFWNDGTFILDYASGNFLLEQPGSVIFTNSGTFLIASNRSPNIFIRLSGSVFHNSGTMRKEGSGTLTFSSTGSFQNHGGTVVADSGTLTVNPPGGPNVSSGGTWKSIKGGTVRIGGPWSSFSGTAVGDKLQIGGISAGAATSVINVGGEGAEWQQGAGISHGANVLELAGTTEAVHSGSTQLTGSLGGYLRNTGTFICNFTGDLTIDMQANSQIRNAGIWENRTGTGSREIYARTTTVVFHNEATGVITQNMTSGTFNFSGGGPGTFRNEGTIVINGQTLDFLNWNMNSSTVNSGDLLEGTYIADGGSMNLPGAPREWLPACHTWFSPSLGAAA